MGSVLESLNSVKEVVEDIDEASKESSEVIINIILTIPLIIGKIAQIQNETLSIT